MFTLTFPRLPDSFDCSNPLPENINYITVGINRDIQNGYMGAQLTFDRYAHYFLVTMNI